MKHFLAILVSATILSGAAMAQDTTTAPTPPPAGGDAPATQTPPSPPPIQPSPSMPPSPPDESALPPGHPPVDADGMRAGMDRPGGPHMRMRMHDRMRDRGARIRIKMGRDMEVDIRCDGNAPFRECVDAAMAVLNRVQAPGDQTQQDYRGQQDYRSQQGNQGRQDYQSQSGSYDDDRQD